MGVRAENWPDDRRSGMAVFFSQIGYKPTSEWKEECVFWDPLHSVAVPGNCVRDATGSQRLFSPQSTTPRRRTMPPIDGGPCKAVLPDGTTVELPPNRDPREVFADWLIRADNPWFARNIVNRVWAWLRVAAYAPILRFKFS